MIKTKVLVCGTGSIGRRHIANLLSLNVDVHVLTTSEKRAAEIQSSYDVNVYTEINGALKHVDAVFIATPTDKHIEVSLKAAQAGKALFIEKPLSHNADGVNGLVRLIKKESLIVEVGCQLRAHPNLLALSELIVKEGPVYTFRAVVGQSLDTWRPGTNYLDSYSSQSSRGGGALFDLVHEIDLIYWLVGPFKDVIADLSNVSHLNINADDLSNLIITTSSGAVGQIQLDMVSPVYRRSLELVYKDAIYSWDYVRGELYRTSKDDSVVVHRVPDGFERNDLFLAHTKHFLKRLGESNLKPLCSVDDGVSVLNTACAARQSAAKGCRITLEEANI